MENNLKEYEKILEEIISKGQDDFEKQLSFISAGALGLSLTFMDKIVKDLPHSSYKGLLISGWILLAFTLVLNLISHLVSSMLHNKTLSEVRNNDNSHYSKSICRSVIISSINWISIFSLATGLVFIIIFSSLNL